MDERDQADDMCRQIYSAGIRNIDAMTSRLIAHRRKRARESESESESERACSVPARMFVLCSRCQTMLDLAGHATGNMHLCTCGANIIIDPTRPPMLCFFSTDTATGGAGGGVGGGVGVSPTEQTRD